MGLFRKTIDTASVQYAGHEIKVVNAWTLIPSKAYSALYIDGVECDIDRAFEAPNPHTPLLRSEGYSDALNSVEVFFAGVFRIKIAIIANGQTIYEDKLSKLDQWHADLVTP